MRRSLARNAALLEAGACLPFVCSELLRSADTTVWFDAFAEMQQMADTVDRQKQQLRTEAFKKRKWEADMVNKLNKMKLVRASLDLVRQSQL